MRKFSTGLKNELPTREFWSFTKKKETWTVFETMVPIIQYSIAKPFAEPSVLDQSNADMLLLCVLIYTLCRIN